jgi:uncharacterized protein with FMN-binding domain
VETKADVVELLSGSKASGKVLGQTDEFITMEVTIGSRTLERKYPVNRIHAVTVGGKRQVLNPIDAASDAKSSAGTKSGSSSKKSSNSQAGAEGEQRSRSEIKALIDKVGRTPPDWYDSTPLNYPQTLDLTFPKQPGGNWNNQKNVGQYNWDVINPNPGKWHEGVKLMHHLLVVNKGNQATLVRVMDVLGRMYHNLLEDYARAAFWWEQAGVDKSDEYPGSSVHLAECYWKLGNKEMAVELLNRLSPNFSMIKVWGDMGETDKALKLADGWAQGNGAATAYMYAGDACRVAGRSQQALAYYQKVLSVPATGQQAQRVQKYHNRATASIEAIKLFDTLDVNRVPDGNYAASSLGYEAQVQISVVVRNRRIESVAVTQHREKQFYSSITDTPRKIVEKQGVKGVDATSGATITSEAIINATA